MSAKITKSVSGKLIRLTDERWQHIKDRHPELRRHLGKMLETVSDPDLVTSGWFDEVIAIRKYGADDKTILPIDCGFDKTPGEKGLD